MFIFGFRGLIRSECFEVSGLEVQVPVLIMGKG